MRLAIVLYLYLSSAGSVQAWWWNKQAKTTTTDVAVAAAHRPIHVLDALAKGEDLYYFGVGSNMLRSKVENRGIDGNGIQLKSMEPAIVRNHRLAFNMRGFLPLEPGMGSLEPLLDDDDDHSDGNHDRASKRSIPLLAYQKPECHGSLIRVDAENYEKIMKSEGVSHNATNPGYEEIVVDAYPYYQNGNETITTTPVKAVALRARPHVRLRKDPAPSERYMTILREGAAELGLEQSYQDFLAQHPVQRVPLWLRRIAVNNLIFSFTLSRILKTRALMKFQSWCLFRTYDARIQTGPRKVLHDAFSAIILLPGCLCGSVLRLYFEKRKAGVPPMMGRLLQMMDNTAAEVKTKKVQEEEEAS